MAYQEYPKILCKDGAEVTVTSQSDEDAKRADGWSDPVGAGTKDDAVLIDKATAQEEFDAEFERRKAEAEDKSKAERADLDAKSGDDNDPTFGPPGDDTHAKRGGKKK
jgi:hypothetical protein